MTYFPFAGRTRVSTVWIFHLTPPILCCMRSCWQLLKKLAPLDLNEGVEALLVYFWLMMSLFPLHHHLILVSHVFIFENKTNKQKNQDWQKLCMKNCCPLRSNLHAFILCFQWTASLYAIEKQLSQGFCISLHTSINNNENTNASYTTLDQMLINVYFHLRWLKNKKKPHRAFQAFICPHLLNQFTAHLTS